MHIWVCSPCMMVQCCVGGTDILSCAQFSCEFDGLSLITWRNICGKDMSVSVQIAAWPIAARMQTLTWGPGSPETSADALALCCLGRCAINRSSLPARAAKGFKYAVLASIVCTANIENSVKLAICADDISYNPCSCISRSQTSPGDFLACSLVSLRQLQCCCSLAQVHMLQAVDIVA